MNLMDKYLARVRERKGQPEASQGHAGSIKGVAVKVYSEALGAYLWVVADEADMEALRASEGTMEAVYTHQEIRELRKLPEQTRRNTLKTVHQAKTEFGSRVISTGVRRRFETG